MTLTRVLRWVCGIVGAAMVVTATAAYRLGLDSNRDWGPSRKLLLAAGLLLIAVGWLNRLRPGAQAAYRRVLGHPAIVSLGGEVRRRRLQLARRWEATRVARVLPDSRRRLHARWVALATDSPWLSSLAGHPARLANLAAWAAFILVCLSYLWFATVGTWVGWPGASSTYHDRQAEAFLHGRLSLLDQPPADLLALPDPYDPTARSGIAYLWDASLYEGRYYLYWGPVPALLLTPIKAVVDVSIRDDVLVLVFSIGALYGSTRILTAARRDFFPLLPAWASAAAVLTVGWANPTLWNLNSPRVYESAIAGGLLFVVMGVFGLYGLLARGATRAGPLALAGLSLALAIGTRASHSVTVLVVAAIVLYRIVRLRELVPARALRTAGVSFLLPLCVGVVGVGAYNAARFESPFEFGHRYQLTGQNLADAGFESLSPANIPPNLYNYLVNPARPLPVFPYLKARWGGFRMSILRLPVPEDYFTEQVTGLLLSSPFAVLALGSISRWSRVRRRAGTDIAAGAGEEDGLAWLTAALGAIVLAEFAVVTTYTLGTMRYLGDFVMVLVLLASLSFFDQLQLRRRQGRVVAAYAWLGVGLMIWTCLAGLLLGITGYHARFERLNPALFHQLTEWFTL